MLHANILMSAAFRMKIQGEGRLEIVVIVLVEKNVFYVIGRGNILRHMWT